MSQICRFYLKGTCKYGNSCHYIHENNYYSKNNKDYSDNSYGYHRNNYNENYSYRNRDSYSSYESPQSSNKNYNQNYNRYHVDHRQQSQPTEIKPEDLTLSQFVDVIKNEVKEFENRHVWKLSVISPIKNSDNLPGFQDYSPEEIRYQFYMASRSNSLQEYTRTVDKLRDELINNCQQVTNSTSVYNIAKQMMSNNNSSKEATSLFQTPQKPSSSFTFDLSALPKQTADLSQQQSLPQPSAFNSFSFAQPPSANAVNGAPVNCINRQSFPNEPSQISSFSFASQSVAAAPAFSFSGPSQTPVQENNPCYSKIEDLSSEQLQAFQAPTFKYGFIPLQPPTKELCTKLSY